MNCSTSELAALQANYDEFIEDSKMLEEELERELTLTESNLAKEKNKNKALQAKFEDCNSKISMLENELKSVTNKLKSQTELRVSAEVSQFRSDELSRQKEARIISLMVENEKVYEKLACSASEVNEIQKGFEDGANPMDVIWASSEKMKNLELKLSHVSSDLDQALKSKKELNDEVCSLKQKLQREKDLRIAVEHKTQNSIKDLHLNVATEQEKILKSEKELNDQLACLKEQLRKEAELRISAEVVKENSLATLRHHAEMRVALEEELERTKEKFAISETQGEELRKIIKGMRKGSEQLESEFSNVAIELREAKSKVIELESKLDKFKPKDIQSSRHPSFPENDEEFVFKDDVKKFYKNVERRRSKSPSSFCSKYIYDDKWQRFGRFEESSDNVNASFDRMSESEPGYIPMENKDMKREGFRLQQSDSRNEIESIEIGHRNEKNDRDEVPFEETDTWFEANHTLNNPFEQHSKEIVAETTTMRDEESCSKSTDRNKNRSKEKSPSYEKYSIRHRNKNQKSTTESISQKNKIHEKKTKNSNEANKDVAETTLQSTRPMTPIRRSVTPMSRRIAQLRARNQSSLPTTYEGKIDSDHVDSKLNGEKQLKSAKNPSCKGRSESRTKMRSGDSIQHKVLSRRANDTWGKQTEKIQKNGIKSKPKQHHDRVETNQSPLSKNKTNNLRSSSALRNEKKLHRVTRARNKVKKIVQETSKLTKDPTPELQTKIGMVYLSDRKRKILEQRSNKRKE